MHNCITHHRERGFTLVEIALVLIISGMFIAAAAQFLKLYTTSAQYDTTVENARITQEALYEFYGRNGYYPCPADPDLDPGNGDYGIGQCRSHAQYNANKDNCNFVPAGIECPDPANSDARDVDGDGKSDIVLIGAFPFREVSQFLDSLPENQMTSDYRELHKKDGYGRLFTYAITESMTSANEDNTLITPARPYDGAIKIEDENGIDLTDIDASAHYVLLSHGDNGRGGYTDKGNIVDDCIVYSSTNPTLPVTSPPPSAAPGLGGGLDLELENCNFENAIFLKGIRTTGNNSNYYDDLIFYRVSESVPIWQVSLNSAQNESYIYNSNEGSAGVGTDAPSKKLHVVGNVLGEGEVVADKYCDGTSETCFSADSLAGIGSTCPEGYAAYGISEGKLMCTKVEWTLPSVDCPVIGTEQSYLHAISSAGRITCCLEDGSNCNTYGP